MLCEGINVRHSSKVQLAAPASCKLHLIGDPLVHHHAACDRPDALVLTVQPVGVGCMLQPWVFQLHCHNVPYIGWQVRGDLVNAVCVDFEGLVG